jgi:8-oxo-dGTP pyrophosphatase MutT (NUDIX family)
MFQPCILSKGPVSLSDYSLSDTGVSWRANPEYDALVAPIWQERVAAAAARDHHLWDGSHYRLVDIGELSGNRLSLGTIDYRYIVTVRALYAQHRQHGLDPPHHISTAALLLTADGHYVFGKRKVNGAIDLIGGGLQPEADVAPDIAHNIAKEVREETGIAAAALGAQRGLGVVMSTTSNVLVIAHQEIALTADGVRDAFATREDDEMAEPVFVPRDDITDYLRSLTDYRPFVAELLT